VRRTTIDLYEKELTEAPRNGMLRIELGDLYQECGRLEEALRTYMGCHADSEHLARARERAVHVLLALGRSLAAEEELRALLDRVGDEGILRHNLGVALAHQERWQEAVKEFERADALGVRVPNQFIQWIRALQQCGDVEAALRVGMRWSAQDSTPICTGALALLHLDCDKADMAEALALKAHAECSTEECAGIVLGTIALRRGDSENAIAGFQNVVSHNPANHRAWVGLGLAQLAAGFTDSAILSLTRGCSDGRMDVGLAVAIGWALLFSGSAGDAELQFQRAIGINRNFAEAHGGLATVLAIRGKREEAESAIRAAKRLDNASYGYKYAQAILELSGGSKSAAARLFDDLLAGSPAPDLPTLGQIVAKVQEERRNRKGSGGHATAGGSAPNG